MDLIGNLDFVVFLLIGSPVYLTYNYCVGLGLANGVMGILKDIIFKEENDGFTPSILLIEFKNVNSKLTTTLANIVPIEIVTIKYERNYKKTRTQFPIKNAFGLTIHKSQGMTG